MNESAQNPAFQALVDALAERLVQDYLTEKTAPECGKPAVRTNHVQVAEPAKAA